MNPRKPGVSSVDLLPVVLLLVVALAAAAPLWGPGIVNTRGGGDSPFLLQRVHQMAVNLRAGVFPVRWMPDAAYGLGYPFFSYYAALPYYLAALLNLIGADILTSIKLTQTLGFLLAALTMYSWMRRQTRGRWAAWLAAVGYTAAPFHMVNVYVRGDSLSEFYAFVFYPLILWALDLPDRTPLRRAGLALAYAGLLLTHNLSALIFTPFALLSVLLRRRPNGGTLRDLGALGVGMALAAWFWVPALAESPLVQLGTVTEGYFHYTNHFRGPDLVQDSLWFDYALTSPGRTPFAMGLLQAVGAGVGALMTLAWLARGARSSAVEGLPRRDPIPTLYILLGLFLSTLMITPLSRFLWDHIPLLPIVQFPWRFLSVQALFAAAVLGIGVDLWPAGKFCALASLLFGALLILAVLIPLHPDRLPIAPEDITRERLLLYELFTSNIGTTIRHEYLYRAVVPRPFTSDAVVEPEAPPRAFPLDGARLEATRLEASPTRQVWRVSGEGGDIAFPLLYWPGWRGSVDGKPVEVGPVEGSGYLFLRVPPGEHTVVLWLGRTFFRALAEGVSLTAALAVAILAARHCSLSPRSVQRAGFLALLLCALCGLSFLRPSPSTENPASGADQTLTMDFIQMPYLHPAPRGVRFEGGDGWAELLGYALSDATPSPGDPLTVTVKWAAPFPLTATVELVSPASVRYDLASLARTTCVAHLCSLTVPPDTPRGLYLLRLRVFGPTGELSARTPAGLERGTLYLTPVRVTSGPPLPPETPILAAFGPEIRLYGATVDQVAPDRLSIRLLWGARWPIPANHGISLRLRGAAGREIPPIDTQPGYGFLPTSMWRPGEMITDRYEFPLPTDILAGEMYTLSVVLYRFPSLRAVGEYPVGPFPLPLETPYEEKPPPRQFTLPSVSYPVEVTFGGEIRLVGYDLAQERDRLVLTLCWQAMISPRADYTRFVHLFDPATRTIVSQNDAPPREGKYPTSLWTTGEVVTETVVLPLERVPPGTYRLAVGMYDATVTRLRVTSADGQPIPDDYPVLLAEVRIEP